MTDRLTDNADHYYSCGEPKSIQMLEPERENSAKC